MTLTWRERDMLARVAMRLPMFADPATSREVRHARGAAVRKLYSYGLVSREETGETSKYGGRGHKAELLGPQITEKGRKALGLHP